MISIERGTPEGAKQFRAPEKKQKQPGRFRRFVKRVGTAAGLGGALIAGEGALPRAQAGDWQKEVPRTLERGVEAGIEYKTEKGREDTKRKRDEQIHTERMKDIEARERERKRREETDRQREMLRHAEATGNTQVKVATTEGETTISVTEQGQTPQERMQEAQHIHEATMAEIEAQKKLQAQLQEAIEAGDTVRAGQLAQELTARRRADAASRRLSGIPGAVQERPQ